MTKQADLTANIFEGLEQRFSDALHQSSAQQLLGELEVAFGLLNDRRLAVG